MCDTLYMYTGAGILLENIKMHISNQAYIECDIWVLLKPITEAVTEFTCTVCAVGLSGPTAGPLGLTVLRINGVWKTV